MSRGTPIYTILVLEEDDGTSRGFMARKYISIKIDYDASVATHAPYYWEHLDLKSNTNNGFTNLTDAAQDAWEHFDDFTGCSVLGWLDPDYVIDTATLLK